MDKQILNQIDPLTKQPEQMMDGNNISPMDPPDSYAPPAVNRVAPEEMHPFLGQFSNEHATFIAELNLFEEAILSVQKTGYTKALDEQLRHFFHFFDQSFVPHSQLEEIVLFPVLHERLIAGGEHSPTGTNLMGAGKGEVPTTPVNVMRDEHLKAVQLAAVILNFMGLACRLSDANSRLIVLDAALEHAKNLLDLLRLHIFREDNIVFPLAHRLISAIEFNKMSGK